MTEKHVHWADTTQEYSPPPRTPSPTWSDDSLPDSASPFTPPSAFQGTSLPTRSPRTTAIEAHPLIAYDLHTPPLLWDVSQPPSLSRTSKGFPRRLSLDELAQPATVPPLRRMEIQCGGLTSWRPVQLVATSTDALIGVTLSELLEGISHYLQTPVSADEFAHFAQEPGMQEKISRAFYARCERENWVRQAGGGTASGNEQSTGLRRVDCLVGFDRFLGLTCWGKNQHIWQLHLAPRSQGQLASRMY